MSKSPIPDLSRKDIRFLRAVRNINESPEEYPATEGGEVAATKTALKKGPLGEEAVRYRFENKAKITTDGEYGLVEILPAPILDKGGYGPKSAELTDRGTKVLDQVLEERDLVKGGVQSEGVTGAGGESDARIAELEERVADMEAKLDRILEAVNRWEESPTGALDEEEQRVFGAVAEAVPAHRRALRALGVEKDEILNAEDLTPEAVRQQVRQTVVEDLGQPAGAKSGGDSDSMSGSDSEQSEQQTDDEQIGFDSLE